jgi:very-short-patch-repair endonuclease
MRLNNLEYLKKFRRQLRNDGTSAEAFLWRYLKNKHLSGRKFRRQHSVGNYILDFYCPKEKLAIELDGEIHNDLSIEEYDWQRTKILETFNITVLRFDNETVFENIENVIEEIQRNFKT